MSAESRLKILEQKIEAKEVVKIIERRLAEMSMHYAYAVNNNEKLKAEAFAEAKWQMAEMKMQLIDFLVENMAG